MIKLPSLEFISKRALKTLQRFPLVLLSAATGAVSAILLVDQPATEQTEYFLIRLLFTAALGLPLFIAIYVYTEKQQYSLGGKIGLLAGGVILLFLYFLTLPEDVFQGPEYHGIRFFLLNIGLHFLVAFAPFLKTGEENGFWQYNKTLFLRFLASALYSGVLFVGLVIALQAMVHLFGVDVKDQRYAQLWIFMAGIFNTWFFLSGIPRDLNALNDETEYPKGLKVFTQFILIPLVVIYLTILYSYEIKIIMAQDWPRGWVANLVLGFSVAGILAILLVYPIREQKGNRWIAVFSKWYYVFLIPLVGMLLLAIWRRVSDYGITENRYFVILLAIWLTATVIYFLAARTKSIRFIPITLCLLAFFAAGGPWGAFSISENSQMGRLETYLSKHSILSDGKTQKSGTDIPFGDRKEISQITRYLTMRHGVQSLQPLFEMNLADSLAQQDTSETYSRHQLPEKIVEWMGVPYIQQWQSENTESAYFHLESRQEAVFSIAEFDYLIKSLVLNLRSMQQTVAAGSHTVDIALDTTSNALSIATKRNPEAPIIMDLETFTEQLFQKHGYRDSRVDIDVSEMTLEGANRNIKISIHFQVLSGKKSLEKIQFQHLMLNIFIAENL